MSGPKWVAAVVAIALAATSCSADDDPAANDAPSTAEESGAPDNTEANTTETPDPAEGTPDDTAPGAIDTFDLRLEADATVVEHVYPMTAGQALTFRSTANPEPADPDELSFGMAADAAVFGQLVDLASGHYDVVEGGAEPAEVFTSLDDSVEHQTGPVGSTGGPLGFTGGCFTWVAAVDGNYAITLFRDAPGTVVEVTVSVEDPVVPDTFTFDPADPLESILDYNPVDAEGDDWNGCIFLP